jgi:hypothetical protein
MSETELLTEDELAELTGRKTNAHQREWLDRSGWSYVVNACGRPIVGRWYARMMLAGIRPTSTGVQASWQPDFSRLAG